MGDDVIIKNVDVKNVEEKETERCAKFELNWFKKHKISC